MKNNLYKKLPKHLVLVFISFLCVFPLYWMIVSSFKGEGEIFSTSLLPGAPTLNNYKYAFAQLPIGRMMLNSFLIAGVQATLQIVTGVMAAYALMRYQFPGKKLVTALLSLAWLIPIQSIMIPNYVTIVNLGLQNNPIAVILPNIASAFAILSLFQAFQSFPRAIVEAAMMDGDGDFSTMIHVVLPNMKASIASLGILLYITSWNDYLWPRLIMNKMESSPIQLGLKSFVSSDVNQWGSLMAATTISCLPILVIYCLLQRRIVDSFVKWGIK